MERRRSFTIGDASDLAAIQALHESGYTFTQQKPTGVALEQIVTMQRESLVGAPDDAYMRPISLGRSKK